MQEREEGAVTRAQIEDRIAGVTLESAPHSLGLGDDARPDRRRTGGAGYFTSAAR